MHEVCFGAENTLCKVILENTTAAKSFSLDILSKLFFEKNVLKDLITSLINVRIIGTPQTD